MHQNLRHRKRAQELALAVDHKELVGMVGQRLKAAQEFQNNLKRDVLADGNHLEVHARTHALFGVAHGRAQLGALFVRQALLHLGHHIGRQIVHQVGDFVGIEPFDRVDELFAVHRLDQGFTNAFAHLDEHVAFVLVAHEAPNRQTLFGRKRFENVGDVGRVQVAENFREFRAGRRIQGRGLRLVGIVARDGAALILLLKDLRDALEGAVGHLGIAREQIVFIGQKRLRFCVELRHCISPCEKPSSEVVDGSAKKLARQLK